MKIKIILIIFFICSTKFSIAQKELWGMTIRSGQHDAGTIFKTDSAGNNIQTVYSFNKSDASGPTAELVEYHDGNLYGITREGGFFSGGAIFQYDQLNDTCIKKADFDSSTGYSPNGLLLCIDSLFYGMCRYGGAHGLGTIFKYNPVSNAVTKLFDFDGNTGEFIFWNFVQAYDGKLYGTTWGGGTTGNGVLFDFDPLTSTYNKILDFNGTTDGSAPQQGLLLASDSMLYGTTKRGGDFDYGVLYQLDPATAGITIKHHFDSVYVGWVEGNLMQASNGSIYGYRENGSMLTGQLFEYNPVTDTFVVKYNGFSNVTGFQPSGKLTEIKNSVLMGMCGSGGVNYLGTIFIYDLLVDTFSTIYEFDGINGSNPWNCSISKLANGRLFGTSYGGGSTEGGTLFEIDSTTNTFNKKWDFNFNPNGSRPVGGLMLCTNGKLYGMTEEDGQYNMGVIFEYDPLNNIYTKRIDFDSSATGFLPNGKLIEASNGKLYGMTSRGGVNDDGVLFEYDPQTLSFLRLIDFDSLTTGSQPLNSLVEISNGTLYGMASLGGYYNFGTLFEFDITTNTFTKKKDFEDVQSGAYPTGNLFEANNNILYGMTPFGGDYNEGVLFEFDPALNIYTKILDFSDSLNRGSFPKGSLIQANNNKLYGSTSQGGNGGSIFEYDIPTTTFLKKQDFDPATDGSEHEGTLLQAFNGKLYGINRSGGIDEYGLLFEYDMVTNLIEGKYDFYTIESQACQDLIEVDLTTIDVPRIEHEKLISIFPNPVCESTINISNSYSTFGNVHINDCTGKKIIERSGNVFPLQIDVSGLQPGIYFITVSMDEITTVQKLIMQ